MPEGDTIYRAATVLRRALAGRVVTGFDVVAPKITLAASQRRIVGGTVKSVESNGKHLMITFKTDGEDVVLHTHMRMTGMWHVYRPVSAGGSNPLMRASSSPPMSTSRRARRRQWSSS